MYVTRSNNVDMYPLPNIIMITMNVNAKIEDVIFDDGFYGELILRSWKEDLKDDSYFRNVYVDK